VFSACVRRICHQKNDNNMNKSLMVWVVALLLVSCGGGGSNSVTASTSAPTSNPPPPASENVSEQLRDDLQGLTLGVFYDSSYEALISRFPETIVWRGLSDLYPQEQATLDNLSDEYRRETFAMYKVVLDVLHTYDRALLPDEEKLNYDVYEWYLQDIVDRLEFIYYEFAATYSLFGVQNETQTMFTDLHPLETAQDAEDYINRLRGMVTKFSQLAAHLSRQVQAGVVEPSLTLNVAIEQAFAMSLTAANSNPYFTRFRDDIAGITGLDNRERQALLNEARAAVVNGVIPAYRQLTSALQGLVGLSSPSIGVGQFPRGRSYYAYMLKHHTTTSLSATQIHQLGLDELQRIHAEMRLIFDQLGYPQNETLQQQFNRVRLDGGVIPAASVKATYESIIHATEQTIDEAFDIFPAADVIVAPDDFGGYYISPSLDGSRPGAFYAGTSIDQPWFQMPTLTYHESIPGHHTQISLALEQDVPVFRKLERATAFTEGWGLYAERLASELGWYDNDVYGELGRLQFEAMRAARLVIDTGIHEFDWSFNQAVQFNVDNVGASNGESQGAAGRYSVIPGQATAYMIGMLKILDERQRAMDELGPLFNLKEFHRVVLESGAIPLDLLDGVIDRYIAAKLATP
jgi:uncharacterized protein (DUF885 family)